MVILQSMSETMATFALIVLTFHYLHAGDSVCDEDCGSLCTKLNHLILAASCAVQSPLSRSNGSTLRSATGTAMGAPYLLEQALLLGPSSPPSCCVPLATVHTVVQYSMFVTPVTRIITTRTYTQLAVNSLCQLNIALV